MNTIAQLVGAFVGVTAIAVVFQVPKNRLFLAGLSGFFGWGAYLFALSLHASDTVAIFAASLAVTLISHILARIVRAPVTLFLIPGIMPLVPGAGMYRIAYSLIYDTVSFSDNLMATFKTAGAIALGIFIVDALFRWVRVKK